MLWLLAGLPGFTCVISFAPVFSFMYCRVLIFALSPLFILIYMFLEMMHWLAWFFYANQTSTCLDPHLNLRWGWRHETSLSPPVKYFNDRSKTVLLLWIICVFVSCVSHAFSSVHCCLVVPWVRCGTLLYRFLIFASFLTLHSPFIDKDWQVRS